MSPGKLMISCFLIVLLYNIPALQSQTRGEVAEEIKIDSKTRAAIIADIGKLLVEKYVFLDVAERMKDHLSAKLKKGDYDSIDDPIRLANVLREDLYEISKDSHFFIEFNPGWAELIRAQQSESEEGAEKACRKLGEDDRRANFGFKRLEHLKGNIGYLDLRFFSNAEYAGETAVAAMNFLANANAVIIDVRNNPGGHPNMVQLLCSYFVKGTREGRTHLNTFERRFDDSIEQFWTIPYLPGQRMYNMDVYILTSMLTGSGAEEFVYNMKNLERATIIGETTGGAAHHVEDVVIGDLFVMHLPSGRPINPISGTNWEKTGVEPHVAVGSDKAFDTAYLMALEKLQGEIEDEDQLFQIRWAMDGLKAKVNPPEVDQETLQKYVGSYAERRVWLDDGQLYYQRTGPQHRLIPLKEQLFSLEGIDFFRVEFITDESGRATRLVGLYDMGMTDISERTQ